MEKVVALRPESMVDYYKLGVIDPTEGYKVCFTERSFRSRNSHYHKLRYCGNVKKCKDLK